jgi:hypothetical protein
MKFKYIMAFGGLQAMNLYTTTNQKQSAATEGTTEGRRNEQEARGSAISLFLEGGSQIRSKNLNKIVEFSK